MSQLSPSELCISLRRRYGCDALKRLGEYTIHMDFSNVIGGLAIQLNCRMHSSAAKQAFPRDVLQLQHRGRQCVGWIFTFTAAADNLIRIRNLARAAPAGAR